MKRNKGQGLVEYALILVLVVVIVVVMLGLLSGTAFNSCTASKPTAGQIVDCIATRTAEAKNR